MTMQDSQVLEQASRLLDKYFHPSRNDGRVPDGTGVSDAKTLLRLAEVRARAEEAVPWPDAPGSQDRDAGDPA
jgi:hypothetical protein